ncbi:MAG TPA: D-glycero-D-manno-heptose 1-phosphate guanosyltransferase [Elusimicrobia bacterium]|nr:D-glycero-D-manno-heptose 1-phosphate guanosyltransferase [Elusimicrobiota bacterium]
MQIDTIILAGGKGTRLSGLLPDIPKPMAPINGIPFLDILLSQLNTCPHITKVILAVGYKSETIISRYKTSIAYNFSILFSEEKSPLGTGGAIKKASALANTEDVLVLNGDSYIDLDIERLINSHISDKAAITVVLKKLSGANRYGNVKVDERRRIISFEEKNGLNHTGLINAGVYLVKRNLFSGVDEDHEISLERQILPDLIKSGMYGYIADGAFIDIGIPADYKRAQTELAGHIIR